MGIGERIRQARTAAGLTQRQLAASLGVTTRSVQNYEAGKSTLPPSAPYRIAHAHPCGWLLAGGSHGSDQVTHLVDRYETLKKKSPLIRSKLAVLTEHLEQMQKQRTIPKPTAVGEARITSASLADAP